MQLFLVAKKRKKGYYMSKKEKLRKKFLEEPKDFTYDELTASG